MADRTYGPVTLWGPVAGPAQVISPLGQVVASGVAVDVGVVNRAKLLVTLPLSNTLDGHWTVLWSDGSQTTFTVGSEEPPEHGTLLQALLELASRTGEAWIGFAESGSRTEVVDTDLLPHLEGYFIIRLSGDEIGLWRRVETSTRGAIFWSHPFVTPIQEGERYALMKLHPERGKTAIEVACRALSRIVRVPVVARGLTLDENFLVTVPRGWNYVYDVWALIDFGGGRRERKRIIPVRWNMEPGRRLLLRDPRRERVISLDLYGYRDGTVPVFWDSRLDRDSQTVVSLAQLELSHSGSGSVVIDPEERLRKAALVLQEQGQLLQLRRYRMPSNAKPVLP